MPRRAPFVVVVAAANLACASPMRNPPACRAATMETWPGFSVDLRAYADDVIAAAKVADARTAEGNDAWKSLGTALGVEASGPDAPLEALGREAKALVDGGCTIAWNATAEGAVDYAVTCANASLSTRAARLVAAVRAAAPRILHVAAAFEADAPKIKASRERGGALIEASFARAEAARAKGDDDARQSAIQELAELKCVVELATSIRYEDWQSARIKLEMSARGESPSL
jgi:hypothetical protein